MRSPLDEPGVNVKEGDYVLAVNGVPLDTKADPWAAFQGLGRQDRRADGQRDAVDRPVRARWSSRASRTKPSCGSARGSRSAGRSSTRRPNGKIGYIYVQSTGVDAQNELVRQFMAQWKKDGLIIDERWNSGGQIPDRFIELLNRPILAYWAVRDGASQQWPPVAHRGPQVMLINGWSGSGGDAFPTYFREAGLGPLIGTRTWGGLIGISGAPVARRRRQRHGPDVPDVRPEGAMVRRRTRRRARHSRWMTIPRSWPRGNDPQLARAIKEVTERAAKAPKAPARPAYEKRVPRAGGSK